MFFTNPEWYGNKTATQNGVAAMNRSLSITQDTLSDTVGLAAIIVATVAMLWLPALIAA